MRAVPAASRTISILRALAGSQHPLTLSEICARTGIIPSTCLHILRILVEETIIAIDPNRKIYQLGIGILPLARIALQRNTVTGLLHPHAQALALRFGVSTMAGEIVNRHIVTTLVCNPPNALALNAGVGSRYPVEVSATGRCYAAFSGVDARLLARTLKLWRWAQVPTQRQWLSEVRQCRELGYGVDSGNLLAGITIISVPVLDASGKMTHTMGAAGVTEVIERAGVATIGESLIAAAKTARDYRN